MTESGRVVGWGARRWIAVLVGAAVVLVVVGLPTEMVPNPLFDRMTPVLWWNYPVWLVSAGLAGLLVATYVRDGNAPPSERMPRGGGAGGLLAFFAVGCPVCNKLVVLALGTSGAMTWFAPVQPLLGLAAVLLLALALRARLRGERDCRLSASVAEPEGG